ncbi:hypothetical protein BC831DRAFT_140087 [Entophlyctis helioformis]|nr:hypothetical protein BC831DRAFT_140087 [Entophlyctis helioformis]
MPTWMPNSTVAAHSTSSTLGDTDPDEIDRPSTLHSFNNHNNDDGDDPDYPSLACTVFVDKDDPEQRGDAGSASTANLSMDHPASQATPTASHWVTMQMHIRMIVGCNGTLTEKTTLGEGLAAMLQEILVSGRSNTVSGHHRQSGALQPEGCWQTMTAWIGLTLKDSTSFP